MADEEYSNLGVALRTYLRESTVLASASYLGSNQNIYLGWPRSRDGTNQLHVPPYLNVLIIQAGRGGRGDLGLAQREERIDFLCYGVDEVRCKAIARALLQTLLPALNTRQKTSFKRNGCQVNTIEEEAAPITLTDPDASDWPYTVVTLLFNFKAQVG